MPRRKPSSPTAAPTYCDSRLPAASTSSTVAGDGVEPGGHEHDRADVGAAEDRPGERVPQRGDQPGAPRPGGTTASQASRRSSLERASPMPVDADLLAGRRGGAERRTGGGRGGRAGAALLDRALDAGPPRGREHGSGAAKSDEQDERRVDRREQHERDGEADDPAEVENSDMNRWSSANTWSRSTRQPVEVLGPLVVLDGRHRRLQPRRRALRARSPTRSRKRRCTAVEHDAQEPGRGGRRARARARRRSRAVAVVVVTPSARSFEPQRDAARRAAP